MAGTPVSFGTRSRDGCFWRPCSWTSSLEPCWIMSELRLWNVELSLNGFQLHGDTSNELTLSRYDTPEGNEPTTSDVLRVSVLLHVLLVRHRCITRISVDLQRNSLDRHMLCSALNCGAAGLKYLKYKGSLEEHIGVRGGQDLWARSIASVSNLNTLCVARVHMDECVASTLGEYVENSWSIREVNLRCVSVFEPNATLFLNSLARNRTVDSLYLEEPFLTAQQGHALAAVLRKHAVLEKISMIGASTRLPSELLRAVVRSPSLKWLDIYDCRLRAEDVEAMAAALALPSTASVPAYDGAPPASPLASMSRLETIAFVSCAQPDRRLEEAYANLIGGGLVRLVMFCCRLGRRFAMLAACKLRADTRMRELSVVDNDIPAPALCLMVQALEVRLQEMFADDNMLNNEMTVNKTLESLGIGTLHSYSCTDLVCLFDLIRGLDCWSRMTFGWIMPCGSQFSDCLRLSKENTVKLMLDELIISDAEPVLDSFASSSKIRFAEILCSWEVESLVLAKLIETLRHTRHLRQVLLFRRLQCIFFANCCLWMFPPHFLRR
ncbi:hypothetical protein HPB50_015167 [Hyalomma asiaticum]|uniref:Uncharacterized protein n=1 Tax=Hyalomma asiaticum TaxID=266040 RepID=A0ACB7RNN5_HYAAI|nr:hypothetical protein HPB50_015167 [Hyalomma asiaticum]